MTNLYVYCRNLAQCNDHNLEWMADHLTMDVECGTIDIQEVVWFLMRQAGNPMYTKQAFLDAARVALEIAVGPEVA